MSSTAEREAQREDVRARIVEAARDIVSEEGLDALSMRALALRIGHSPGTIYLHFQDKDELLGSVMSESFKRLGRSMEAELGKLGEDPDPLERYAAMGRGYARFALENTGYFRSMFEMPGVAEMKECRKRDEAFEHEATSEKGVEVLTRAMESGAAVEDPDQAAVIGWALMHGLTSLYLSGHLAEHVESHDEFMELVESALEVMGHGWLPR